MKGLRSSPWSFGSGNALIVENNYGYQDPLGPNSGALTRSGFARVDVSANGTGCRKVWTNHEARAPTVVPKLSIKTGLSTPTPGRRIRTGRRATTGPRSTSTPARPFGIDTWARGSPSTNNYSGLALGPHGTAFLGTAGGIVSLRDGS